MVASSQRTALLEKYRYINVEHNNWWDCVESDFTEDMKQVGIEVDKIYFSGFWSQGDGACFVGSLDNALTYLNHHHVDQFPMLRKLIEMGGGVWATSEHRGRYYHSSSVSINAECDPFWQCANPKSELQEAVIQRWDGMVDKEIVDFEAALAEQWRTYMNDLYTKLEEEHDYLTSDDAVWDTLEANELIEEVEEEEDA
jgi:hypothetical protein